MSGLLGFTLADLSSMVDSRKRQYANLARGLLSDPGATLAQLSAQDAEAAKRNRYTQTSGSSVMPEVAQQGQQAMMEAVMNLGGLLGITAFHGSPHKFDKFDMSKIGTGEGAQAYGHGLYFAENPATAGYYKDVLSQTLPAKIDGGGASTTVPHWLASKIQADGLDPAIKEWTARAAEQRAAMKTSMQPWIAEGNAIRMEEELAAMQKMKEAGGAKVTKPGAIYKVDIPDDAVAKMLDWDKPLSQQPEAVRKALKPLLEKVQNLPDSALARGERAYLDNPESLKGSDVYNMYRRYFGGDNVSGADASELLRKAGIPGIRYLDAGSRGKGGTSNFVLFDDTLPKILSRE